MVQGRTRGVGDEGRDGFIPRQLATTVAVEVDHGGPAARHGDGLTGDFLLHCPLAHLGADCDASHACVAHDLGDGLADQDADTGSAGCLGQGTGGAAAGV